CASNRGLIVRPRSAADEVNRRRARRGFNQDPDNAKVRPPSVVERYKQWRTTRPAMSPLQYQKLLRLQEARRLLMTDAVDAATAGHRVGYESPASSAASIAARLAHRQRLTPVNRGPRPVARC